MQCFHEDQDSSKWAKRVTQHAQASAKQGKRGVQGACKGLLLGLRTLTLLDNAAGHCWTPQTGHTDGKQLENPDVSRER